MTAVTTPTALKDDRLRDVPPRRLQNDRMTETTTVPAGLFIHDDGVLRCQWCRASPEYRRYHDEEWGFPVTDERRLFEKICLEGFQAGLSWLTILKKREAYRKAFDNFNPEKIARYGEDKIGALLDNPAIVRNRAKIEAAITNARAFMEIQEQYGSFDEFVWQFVGGRPKRIDWSKSQRVPASTRESDAMSKDLKRRGFRFVGSTICYAFMQATGMVNDHARDCFRRNQMR